MTECRPCEHELNGARHNEWEVLASHVGGNDDRVCEKVLSKVLYD